MQCLVWDHCDERIEEGDGYAIVTTYTTFDNGRRGQFEYEWCYKCAVKSRGVRVCWDGSEHGWEKRRERVDIEWVDCQPPADWEPEEINDPLPGQLDLFPAND